MARIRTIKPEFWQDEKLAPLPPLDRLVFLGLISQADDAGRLVDSVRMLDGLLFPYTEDSSRDSLETLTRLGRVIRYTSESGQRLLQITNWEQHQRVEHASKYTLPGPSPEDLARAQDTPTSPNPHETLPRPSGDTHASTLDLGPTSNDLRSTDTSKPAEPVVDLWEIWTEELGGSGRAAKLTAKRRQKLRDLYREQLAELPDPLAGFRSILQAVKRSAHHMGDRAYQMPDSLFRNAERRDSWAQKGLNPSTNGKHKAAPADDWMATL